MANLRWSCCCRLALFLVVTLFAQCHGSRGGRGRTAGPAVLRPVVLLETEQGLSLGPQTGPVAVPPAAVDDVALMELDQLLSLFQGKGKRSQDQADKGLTRDLVTQVLQPGGAGMWFGPRLGRRRRRSVPTPTTATAAHRRKRSLQDGDVDNDIPWKLAEILKELQGPKRSPAPCDQSDINCLLASIASGSAAFAPEQQQHSRAEGNLVNFTPRLGRNSGEQGLDDAAAMYAESADGPGSAARQLRTDTDPLWFSPRLGRRLLPLGTLDVHGPAGAVPPPQPQPHPQPRGMRAARSTEAEPATGSQGQGSQAKAEQASQERPQV